MATSFYPVFQTWYGLYGGGASAPLPANLMIRGNSIPAGFTGGDPYGSFTTNGLSEKVLAAYNAKETAFLGYAIPGNKVDNRAKPARRWQELIGYQQDGSEFLGYDPDCFNMVFSWEITNASSGTEFKDGEAIGWVTPAQNVALGKQYYKNWNDRYPNIPQITATGMSRTNDRPYNPDADFDQSKLNQNTNRAYREEDKAGTLGVKVLLDIGADGILGAPWASENTNLFYDGTHLSETGATEAASLIADGFMKARYPAYVMPALRPIPNLVTTATTTQEDAPTRSRRGPWQLGVQSSDFSEGKVNVSEGPNDGSVSFQEGTTQKQYTPRGAKSPNGGAWDILVNGVKETAITTYNNDTLLDQALYNGQAPAYNPYANGGYITRYVKRGGNAMLEDNTVYSGGTGGGSGGQLASPALAKPSPTDDGGTLSWSDVGASTYVLEESQSSSFASGVTTAYSGPSLSTTLTGRAYRENYYYRVRASKAGSTSSVSAIAKMTPGSPASKPPAIDQNGVLLDVVSTAGITPVGAEGVSPWTDVVRNIAFSTANDIKPRFLPSDPAYNGQPTVLFYGNTDFGAPTTLSQLQEFDLYIGAGVPDGVTQVLLSNRINGNSWWSVNSNQIQLGPDLPLNFTNTNYGKAFFLLVKFRLNSVTVELNGVQVAQRSNPASFTNPNNGLLMAFQYDGVPIMKSTCSLYRVIVTQPRSNPQRLNDNANFFYDLAI